MSCETCKAKTTDEHGPGPIPKYYFEGIQAKDERTNKRLAIALTIVSILLSACVCACFLIYRNCTDKIQSANKDCAERIETINKQWIDYISQYDFEDYTVDLSTDGGGNANYIGANGDIYNGTSGSTQTDTETEGRQSEGESDTP